MAVEALQTLIITYGMEHTEALTKEDWVKFCTHDAINLSADQAGMVFDQLDLDGDGYVKIADILREMKIWESNQALSPLPKRSAKVNGSNDSPSSATVETNGLLMNGSKKDNHGPQQHAPNRSTSRRNRLNDLRQNGFYSQTPPPRLNGPLGSYQPGGGFEVADDGSEIYSTTPRLMNRR